MRFTCISGTKDFLDTSVYVFIQTETGATVLGRTLLSNMDTKSEYYLIYVRFYDNNADNRLNAGDTIYINTDSGAHSSGILGNDMTITLAENIQISNTPTQPYILRSTGTEIIPIIPATAKEKSFLEVFWWIPLVIIIVIIVVVVAMSRRQK